MEGWRDGGIEGWNGGGMEWWRDGGMEGWSECRLPLGTPACNSLRSTPLFKTTTFMEVVSNWEGGRGEGKEGRKKGGSGKGGGREEGRKEKELEELLCGTQSYRHEMQLNSLPQGEWSGGGAQRH